MFEKELSLAAARNVSAQVRRTKKNCPYLVVRGSGSRPYSDGSALHAVPVAKNKYPSRGPLAHLYWYRSYNENQYLGPWDVQEISNFIRFYAIARDMAQAMLEIFGAEEGDADYA